MIKPIRVPGGTYQCKICGLVLYKYGKTGQCCKCGVHNILRKVKEDEFYCDTCGHKLSVEEMKKGRCKDCKEQHERIKKSLLGDENV